MPITAAAIAVFLVLVVVAAIAREADDSRSLQNEQHLEPAVVSRTFHVTFPNRWEYDVVVEVAAPYVTASADHTSSPPGSAVVDLSFGDVDVVSVGTIEGRFAPERKWQYSVGWNKREPTTLDAPYVCERSEASDATFECDTEYRRRIDGEIEEAVAADTVHFLAIHPTPDFVRLGSLNFFGECPLIVPLDPTQPVVYDTTSDRYAAGKTLCELS